MSRIPNVVRKHGTYYFRRIVRLGDDKPFRLRLSLKTTCPRTARLMAPALTLISERRIMNVMTNLSRDGLTAPQRAEIFRRQMLVERDRLEAMHANLQIFPVEDQLDIEDALKVRLDAGELANLDGVAKGSTKDFLVGHFDPDDDDAPIVIMAWSDLEESFQNESPDEAAGQQLVGLGLGTSKLNQVMARKVIHQARVEAIREFRSLLTEPSNGYGQVPVASYAIDNHTAAPPAAFPAPSAALALPANPTEDSWARMSPTEAAVKFIDHNPRTGGADGKARKKGPTWTNKTREQFKLPALMLEQVIGGRALATITHDDLVALHNCFERLHGSSFRKSPRQRQMTILEIADETDRKVQAGELQAEGIGLGLTTTNRHWGFLRQLTDWFAENRPLAKLDYSAFLIDDDRNARDQRDAYNAEQGEALFRLPPWTGCKSLKRRMQPGSLIVHDAYYFVPLIAWYAGLRRDEICGLELADVACEDGLWHFVIQPNSARTLKTTSSERKIPFARELIRLQLPEYVTALRSTEEHLLFPELVAESGIGTMGDAFYKKMWTKLVTALPFLGGGQGIHAVRHSAINFMKEAGIDAEVRADFAGHKIKGETGGRYSKATMLSVMHDAVNAIPEVTKYIVSTPISLLPATHRMARKRSRNSSK